MVAPLHAELETDYLVVGAGAAGMAFTDALLAHSDAAITIVDRRHAPGGHWVDAYPYVRLHQPSTFYGVDSVPVLTTMFAPTLGPPSSCSSRRSAMSKAEATQDQNAL